jgi:hypothetical protein
MKRAQKLMAAAARNPFKDTAFPSHLISLELLINLLLQYQEHLAKLDKSIDALADILFVMTACFFKTIFSLVLLGVMTRVSEIS